MTPLIQKAVKFAPEPETAMWFDVGQMPPAQDKSVLVDVIMNLPYKRMGIVGLDSSGKDFCLWLLQGNGTVTVGGGSMWHNTYFEPFAYIQHEEGVSLYRKDKEINTTEVLPVHRMVIATLDKLEGSSVGYKGTPQNTFINKKRQAKGKPALTFDWHTVKIEPQRPKTEPMGGTHASPRKHQVRGYWRTYKSGKRGWVKDCSRGDASKGVVFKDYQIKDQSHAD